MTDCYAMCTGACHPDVNKGIEGMRHERFHSVTDVHRVTLPAVLSTGVFEMQSLMRIKA